MLAEWTNLLSSRSKDNSNEFMNPLLNCSLDKGYGNCYEDQV
jgi:hypothetical protein